jgi:hypothetical protein
VLYLQYQTDGNMDAAKYKMIEKQMKDKKAQRSMLDLIKSALR